MLRLLSTSIQRPEPPAAVAPISAPPCVSFGSRSTKNSSNPTTKPGIATIQNTHRHDGTTSKSCVAMIGPNPRPSSAKPLCCRPWLKPRRLGREATATAVKLVGQYEPSIAPISARITIRPISPVAMPDNPDKSENKRIAGISTLRWPILSDNLPLKIAKTPHVRPSAPTRLPRSWKSRPRSIAIVGKSGAMIQRSSPTSPNPRPSNVTARHSYAVSHDAAAVARPAAVCCMPLPLSSLSLPSGRRPACCYSSRALLVYRSGSAFCNCAAKLC